MDRDDKPTTEILLETFRRVYLIQADHANRQAERDP